MAEGLGESLSIIGDCIEDIQIDIELFPTDSMIHLVSEFYGQVFIFLAEVMDWIMAKKRKRLLKSFNDDLVATFEKDLERIVKRAERILRRAAQSSRAEGQFVRFKLESLDNRDVEDTRLGSTGLARQLAERQYVEERLQLQEARIEAYRQEDLIRQQRLGHSLKLLLEEHLRNERSRPLLLDIPGVLPGEDPRKVAISLQSPRGKFTQMTNPVFLAKAYLLTQLRSYLMILRSVRHALRTTSVVTESVQYLTTIKHYLSSQSLY